VGNESESTQEPAVFEAGSAPDTPSPKPKTYKVICVSLYLSDIKELEAKVAELKRRGWKKANKSLLIRLALAQIDLDNLTNLDHSSGV
jgi:hypothetical protein